MLAAIHGNRQVLQLALGRHFSINAIDDRGYNALYHAIDNDHETLAIELLTAGIHWNLAISKRATLMAKTKDFKKYMDVYKEKSGDVERRHEEQVRRERPRVIQLPSVLHVKALEDDLIHSCVIGDFVRIKEIVENPRCNINFKEMAKGMTALMCAAINNRTEIMDFLVEKGAKINIVDYKKRSALHHATFQGSKKAIYKLLSYDGIIVHRGDDDNKSPIFYAIENRLENVVRKMMEFLDINHLNSHVGRENLLKYTLLLEKQKPNKYISLLSLLYSLGVRTYVEHLWEKQLIIQAKMLNEIDLDNKIYLQEVPQYEELEVPEYEVL